MPSLKVSSCVERLHEVLRGPGQPERLPHSELSPPEPKVRPSPLLLILPAVCCCQTFPGVSAKR